MKSIKGLILVSLIGCWNPGPSQNIDFQFEHISIDDGLPGLVSLYFAHDKRGFMYIGSWDAGLIRFDGYDYKQYKHDPKNPESFPPGAIFGLSTDSNDNLWINLSGVLTRLDPKTEKFKKYPLPGQVSQMTKDQNHLYVGGTFGLLRYSNDDQFDSLWNNHRQPIGKETGVSCILPISSSEVWFITLESLVKLNTATGEVRNTLFNKPLEVGFHASMVADRFGDIWIGTYVNGLYRFDTARFEFEEHSYERTSKRPSKNFINQVYLDKKDRMFIATNGSGLTVFDKTFSNHRNYLPENIYGSINGRITGQIFQDYQQNIWIGTFGDGINKINLDKQVFRYYESYKGKGDGLPGRIISGMAEGKDGAIWLGFDDDGGLVRFDPKTEFFRVYRQENGLINDKVSGVWEDQAGNIWVSSTSTGLCRYKVSGSQLKLDKTYHNIKSPMYICFNQKSGLWVGEGAVNNNKLFKYQSASDSFLPTDISVTDFTPAFDDAGNLISYSNRDRHVIRVDHETLQVEILGEEKSGQVLVLRFKGKLWILDNNELVRMDLASRKTDYFGAGRGFPANAEQTVSLISDNHGNIWFTTNEGIYRFDLKSETITKIRSDSRFTQHTNGLLMSSEGSFYIADHNGFVVFNPDSVRLDPRPINTAITGFSLNNEPVPIYNANDSSTYQSPLLVSITDTKYLELTHHQNDLTFAFTAFEYSSPDEMKFRYKLDNYNDDWVYTNPDDRTVNYTNLSPGLYNFIVQATLSDQWDGEPTQLSIRILPPWWLTWWAYFIYGICFSLGVFGVHRYQKAAVVKKERERIKDRELEQARKIEKAYQELEVVHRNLKSAQSQLIQSEKMASLGELTAGIAHEIQNPLNFVNNFAEVNAELVDEIRQAVLSGNASEAVHLADDIKQNLEKINFHGKRADGIVKSMLQHSRNADLTGKNKKEPVDINALAEEYLRLAYHGLRAKDKDFNASLKTEFDESIGRIEVIGRDIARAILNLITNAFYAVHERSKRMQSNGEPYTPTVSLTTKKLGPAIEIRVKDNGWGIPDQLIDKIFQPFFTTKPTGQGTGLGLSLCYDIVKAHGGTITVNTFYSPPGGEKKVESEVGSGSEFIIQLPFV